ncbi:hypothetical protein [Vreelandella populi]|uniref:Uncharacterized protein n=1 Tax=Vreelandella populi TaxID=2498858 RepID=A0A433L8G6_9GAMM|nr:hypothetical protein [Halomonas populi]RUR40147.1 hypothetical protein ELY25_04920 [Halomonas populi]RUR43949.1 hypothetical protein ELY37_16185 [Halomonas populi]
MPQNHACSPKAIYLEITGHHEDNAQNEYWLYQGDDAVERLAEGDASEGRFGPIVESQKEFLEEELADYRLVQKIGDIEVPLLQVEEVSQCGLIPKQRAFQHNLMVSTVPMLYLDHHELAAGPCRGGFIYVFLQGRLIRELVVTRLVNGTLQFLDSDIAAYREQGEVPTVREFSGPALSHVHLPLKLNGETTNVRLAFSDHPWPWVHIEQLEANPDLIEKRCQPLALNESAVSVMLQGQGQNLYQHGLEVNRDACAGKAWLDWLPPMRARDAVYEQAWGSPRDYIEDLTAEGWSALLDQLASERTFFDSDEQEASFPDIDMARRQRNFSPALRGTLLQQWCNPLRSDEEQAEEAQLALMPTPAATEDCFAPLRDQKLCCIFLRDPKQATEHLIADIQASTELLMVLAESMKYHPHGASAELVHANCFMDKGPDGENNPRYLDDWLDRRLDRSRESLFSRLAKIEERRLARLRRDEALSALADLWDDTAPGALVHTLHDAMLFDDINLLEPYIILARSIDILLNGTQPFDPKGTTDELSDYQSPARCHSTLETLYKGEHLASALLFEPERCKENGWGEAYARDVGRITQASQQILAQEANAATMTANDLLALQNQLVEETNPTADVIRRVLNGSDAIVINTLPPLIAAIPWLKLGQSMSLDIASDYADLKGALGGGLPIKAELQGGGIVWIAPREFKTVTAEMAQASAALQATATTNALGGNAVSSSGSQAVRVTGRETGEWRFYGARTGYTAFWAVLAVLETFNLLNSSAEFLPNWDLESGAKLGSAGFDAFLLSAQGLKLANSQWNIAVKINNFLDSSYVKPMAWQDAMGEAARYRGGFTLVAGLLTTTLVANDAYQLAQRGEQRAAWLTAAQAASMGVATVYGSGFGEAAGRISKAQLTRNQLVNRMLGWVGTSRPVPITIVSLVASVFFQYLATNNRDDGFSLWVQYGPFGSRRDELEGRLAKLSDQEDDSDSVAIHDYLVQLRGVSPHQAYLYLLQGLHDTYAELVSPRALAERTPRFADCDIAVKFSCAGLRYGEFQLPPLGVSADYLAPVPDMGFTYQYYSVVKGQRLVASAEAEDPEDNAIRYLGISLPREWRRTGIPRSHLGVDPNWLRTSRERFQHEPDYTREYHQKANLVRLYLDDLTGHGSIQFWDRASRTYQSIEDEMTFTTHPSSLTWVWRQQGAR